jgi:Flp pilus assembly protein TadB
VSADDRLERAREIARDAGGPRRRWRSWPRGSDLESKVRAARARGAVPRSVLEDYERLQELEARPRWRRVLGTCGRLWRGARVWSWQHPRLTTAGFAFVVILALWLWLGSTLFGLALLALAASLVFAPRRRRRRGRSRR